MKDGKNIAHISPSEEAYSETFIQMHRKGMRGNVVFYFGGELPTRNDVQGKLSSLLLKIRYKIRNKLSRLNMSYKEYALLESFKKNNIDVVVAEYGTTAGRVLAVCKEVNVPLIPIFHGYDVHMYDVVKKNRQRYTELFSYCKKLIAVSFSMKQKLVSIGCAEEKIVVTPCAPDDAFFDITPEFLSKNLISVGRFVEKKAPKITIRAFAKAAQKHPDATLQMIGKGPLYDTCKKLIGELNMHGKISLEGVKNKEEILSLFSKSSIYVQHSVVAKSGDSEGTPVSVLEAQAAGLPVVATAHEGIKDVVINGKTGFLVEEQEIDAMAAKIEILLSDLSKARTMGASGRKRTQEKYAQKAHMDIINEILYSE